VSARKGGRTYRIFVCNATGADRGNPEFLPSHIQERVRTYNVLSDLR